MLFIDMMFKGNAGFQEISLKKKLETKETIKTQLNN